MDPAAIYGELYGRIPPLARSAVDGLDADGLAWVPTHGSNSIAWLVWHCARLQDHHISELLATEQLWVADGWAQRIALHQVAPLVVHAIKFGGGYRAAAAEAIARYA